MIIWLIGLSGAGKTTIGHALREQIVAEDKQCVFFDGDIWREILGNDLGHTLADRKTNAERICRFCKYLDTQNINVVFGILSLFHEHQAWNRENIDNYFEVFVDAPLELLIERDNKGLYQKAIKGLSKNVAGIDLEFLPPIRPDLVIKNDFTELPKKLAQDIFSVVRGKLR